MTPALINVPVGQPPDGYRKIYLGSTRLTPAQAIALAIVRTGLEESGATLRNGRKVDSVDRVIQWFLEQIPQP